jgi:hypothetical protein
MAKKSNWPDLSDAEIDANEKEAIRRFNAGEPFGGSTNIAEQPTYGYGRLDDYGFWEYQIPTKLVDAKHASKS